MRQIVLGVTGASGAIYARRLVQALQQARCRVHAIVSPHGLELLKRELGLRGDTPEQIVAGLFGAGAGRRRSAVVLHRYDDLADVLASGSVHTDGMAICPCSSNTLAAVAAGLSDNLLRRAAQVHLKERRPLVLVPREMPVSAIDLENQLRLARAGAVIAPACPGFYNGPTKIRDVVDFVAGRVAACLGVSCDLAVRYGLLGRA